MSKTKRKYLDGMCLKHNSLEKQAKQDKANLKDIVKDGEKIKVKKDVPESWDDRPVAALSETKYRWKNGVEIKVQDDFFNVYFANDFVANLTKEELKVFPWTVYLPIDAPPDMAEFKLV